MNLLPTGQLSDGRMTDNTNILTNDLLARIPYRNYHTASDYTGPYKVPSELSLGTIHLVYLAHRYCGTHKERERERVRESKRERKGERKSERKSERESERE